MSDPMSERSEELPAHRAVECLVWEHELPNEDVVRLVFAPIDRVYEFADRLTASRHDQSRHEMRLLSIDLHDPPQAGFQALP
jgi:hypothetical protein